MPWSSRFKRQFDHYPSQRVSMWICVLAALAQLVFYWQFFVIGAATPLITAHFGMSTTFYANIIAFSVASGAVGAFLASGRFVRSNKAWVILFGVVFATLWVGLFIPHALNKWLFGAGYVILNLSDGFILVSTLAILRDFSPRANRGFAMAIGLVGMVGGTLAATSVAALTLNALGTWQSQYYIAAGAGAVVAVLLAVSLKDLSPDLRAQVIESAKEREDAAVIATSTVTVTRVSPKWWQVYTIRNVGVTLSGILATGIYGLAASFMILYLSQAQAMEPSTANSYLVMFWVSYVLALVIAGVVSDRILVRKPIIVIGVLIALVGVGILVNSDGLLLSPVDVATVLILLGVGTGFVSAVWYTAFSEHIESWNSLGTEVGSSMFGTLSRIVGSALGFLFPVILSQGGWTGIFWYFAITVALGIPGAVLLSGAWSSRKARQLRDEHASRLRAQAAELRQRESTASTL